MEDLHNNTPPRLALLIFRWFCKAEFQEDIEGDLYERFHWHSQKKGVRRARWLFVKDVILLLRPTLLGKPSLSFHIHYQKMNRHQFIRLAMVGSIAGGAMFCILRNDFNHKANNQISETAISTEPGQIFPAFVTTTISQNPVSNAEWSEFIRFIESDTGFSKEYVHAMIPDGWQMQEDDKPVSGVSWQQAQEFCKWRSVITTYNNSNSEKAIFSQMLERNKSAKELVTFRLPTAAEFNELVSRKNINGDDGFICVYSVKRMI
jgi:hypothetical protein